jgi:hypothetical protein
MRNSRSRRSVQLASLLLLLTQCTDRTPMAPESAPAEIPDALPIAAIRCTFVVGGAKAVCASTGAGGGDVVVATPGRGDVAGAGQPAAPGIYLGTPYVSLSSSDLLTTNGDNVCVGLR